MIISYHQQLFTLSSRFFKLQFQFQRFRKVPALRAAFILYLAQSVFFVMSVFKRCTGHNTGPIVLISLQLVRSSCRTMAKLFQENRISGFFVLP